VQTAGERHAVRLAFVAWWLFLLALLAIAIGWHKSPDGPFLAASTGGILLVGGAAFALALLVAAGVSYRAAGTAGRRVLQLALAANVTGLALALVAAEVLLRALAAPSGAGLLLGPVTLPPTWQEIRARNRALLAGARGEHGDWLSYVVADPDLGWSIGPSRATPDGLYFSSREGIRSARPGIAFAARRPALRIALVGDSHTFSMDGRFEDSWGHQLEALLGPRAQVLNFGVDGYGIDQSWLRWRRDVRPWRPDIVLFGFVQHDLVRTLAVYPFLSFGWDYPFAKPRFVVSDHEPRQLNAPLVTPDSIVALEYPAELPFAALDLGYRTADWRWREGRPPLLARLFGTAFRRWPGRGPEISDDAAVRISGTIVAAFLREARSDGAHARVLYFPTAGAGDFAGETARRPDIAWRMLAEHDIDHLDLGDCVRAVPARARLVPGRSHYTARANAAVARCVARDLQARGWLRDLVIRSASGAASTSGRLGIVGRAARSKDAAGITIGGS
jgi:hypothetical protein